MSEEDRDRFRGLIEADRRYVYDYGPRIRDEVVLRTACGCEKIVSTPNSGSVISVSIRVGPTGTRWDPTEDATCMIRRFIFEGQQDPHGRLVYEERVYAQEPWEQRYRELYHDVYGMDKGL